MTDTPHTTTLHGFDFNAGDRVIVSERAGYIKWTHVNYLGEGRPSVYVVFDDGAENGWQLISSMRLENAPAPEQTDMPAHTSDLPTRRPDDFARAPLVTHIMQVTARAEAAAASARLSVLLCAVVLIALAVEHFVTGGHH